MGSRSRPRRLRALLIAAVGSSLGGVRELLVLLQKSGHHGCARRVDHAATTQSRPVFADLIRQTSTGRNLMATGNPEATRMVIYEADDGSKKLTMTVDQYGSPGEASSAYQQAVQKSQSVPGFKPVRVPKFSQQALPGP